MKVQVIILFLLAGVCALKAQTETVIIFHQGERETDFTQKKLSELSLYLQAMSVPVVVVDIQKQGAVAEVAHTPAILYQNQQGTYSYKGRYTEFGKVENFIRTSRVISPLKAEYHTTNKPLMTEGKMQLLLELKISPLQGKLIDTVGFHQKMMDVITKTLNKERFKLAPDLLVRDNFVKFYFDFHPFLADDGKLYVSYALFSHYDCINPIFVSNSSDLKGESHQEKAIAQATKAMADFLKKNLKNSQLGDALTPVAASVAVKTWGELGVNLSPVVDKVQSVYDINIYSDWVYAQSRIPNAPALAFHFAPPAQQYAGEVKEIKGWLQLGENGQWAGTKGEFVVATHSVTMGLKELDQVIYNKLLQADSFPEAKLIIKNIKTNSLRPQLGESQNLEMQADLYLKNSIIPLTAVVQADCYLDEHKSAKIGFKAQFVAPTLHKTLNIEVPTAPEAEKGNMIFNANIEMRAKEQ